MFALCSTHQTPDCTSDTGNKIFGASLCSSISMFDPLLSSGSTCESRSIFVEARQRGFDASKMEAIPTNREAGFI